MSGISISIVDLNTTSQTNDPESKTAQLKQLNLISLPPPDNSNPTQDYLTIPHDIYEIRAVPPTAGKYASYFLGSNILSNPMLHVMTRVDPLFFVLAQFHRDKVRSGGVWRPLDQALENVPRAVLRALDVDPSCAMGEVGQLGHLVEVSEACGGVCRFSEERTLRWLVAKLDGSVRVLRVRLLEKKRRREAGTLDGGAFSPSFVLAENDMGESTADGIAEERETCLDEEEERSARVGGLQLICGYLPTEWRSKLANAVGLSDEDWIGIKKDTDSPPRKRRWEGAIGQADAEALVSYSTGVSNGGGVSVTPGENDVRHAQSAGLKRLAKVNTKGMKSLTSFFGAGTKK